MSLALVGFVEVFDEVVLSLSLPPAFEVVFGLWATYLPFVAISCAVLVSCGVRRARCDHLRLAAILVGQVLLVYGVAIGVEVPRLVTALFSAEQFGAPAGAIAVVERMRMPAICFLFAGLVVTLAVLLVPLWKIFRGCSD